MSKFTIVSLALIASIFAVTYAATEAEIKAIIKAASGPVIQACSQELSIPIEEIMTAKESKNIEALNPCFYKCFFSKFGLINENGLFDADVAIESGKKLLGEESLESIKDAADTCSAVNDQATSDTEGCERSKLLLSCLTKEKHSFLAF